ncbi:hypothetical protein H696_06216 [Fonticula alba]|uniref:Uncharacterized protein n=1 Tax=Fonticula alba TaxID=691883 RepID=A0A058YZF7_FONAL|nr:hypothetical protein H696_06216 [Fonticula alba]KCV67364.1 hypothetical protein H696_06216 [Fonticula alba]|eukprot:XP_009498237.1 hypothetical protein H696_06216 [Fonticula alba]
MTLAHEQPAAQRPASTPTHSPLFQDHLVQVQYIGPSQCRESTDVQSFREMLTRNPSWEYLEIGSERALGDKFYSWLARMIPDMHGLRTLVIGASSMSQMTLANLLLVILNHSQISHLGLIDQDSHREAFSENVADLLRFPGFIKSLALKNCPLSVTSIDNICGSLEIPGSTLTSLSLKGASRRRGGWLQQ